MTALVLDTETTGFDEPQPIEISWMGPLESSYHETTIENERWEPTKPIQLGALATHHIIESDLALAPPWPGQWPTLPAGVEYLVGHHVDFDWKAIGSPAQVQRICTLALSRMLWPDLDSHSLGAMTYFTHSQYDAREVLRGAHSACVDVHLCWRLLQRIIDATGAKTWTDLYAVSEKARVPIRMDFGKYGKGSDWAKANNKGEGMRCANVSKYDPGYYDWLFSGKCDRVNEDPYLQKALRGEAA